MTHGSLASVAESSGVVRRLRELARWTGAGRGLTQTGRIKLADARTLVTLLQTGDEFDPKFHGHVYKTKSSDELYELSLLFNWSKAAGLVRVVKGRLLPVKKGMPFLDRPLDLWDRAFEVFPHLGEAVCPSGWGESLLRREFEPAMTTVLTRLDGGPLQVGLACALAWEVASERWVIADGSEQHRDTARRMNDRDTELALEALERLGAVRLNGRSEMRLAELTALGQRGMGRLLGAATQGEPIYQIKVALREVSEPTVWRRLQVSAGIRLDRLHSVLQAAMGWQDSHLHMFTADGHHYGDPDPELELRDERGVRLADLVRGEGTRIDYTYDFGDDWKHEIIVEKLLGAEGGGRYPVCVAGEGACPPEDCGGPPGYQRLRETLADPADPEYEETRIWLGLGESTEFGPERFELGQVNRALRAIPLATPSARR